VVATAVGGNPELVADGESGWLIPAGDPGAMVVALHRYLDDPILRRTHAAAARRRVEQHFSLAAMVDAYLAVYDAGCAGNPALLPSTP
jgi:glycosyltransferase involved in cell wall biosynthesis